jgi:hypothetical protein
MTTAFSGGSDMPGAIFSQLELQHALFQSLLQKILSNKLSLMTILSPSAGGPVGYVKSPSETNVLRITNARARAEIRTLVADSRALSILAVELESDFILAANAHIVQTSSRVVHLVEVASRNAAFCSADVVVRIQTSIDNANAEIARVAELIRQIGAAADTVRDVAGKIIACTAGWRID